VCIFLVMEKSGRLVILPKAPTAKNAVNQQHGGKNIPEFGLYAWHETLVEEKPGTQPNVNDGHGSAQDKHRSFDGFVAADAIVGKHGLQNFGSKEVVFPCWMRICDFLVGTPNKKAPGAQKRAPGARYGG